VTPLPPPEPVVLPAPGRRARARRAVHTARVTARRFRALVARRVLRRPLTPSAFAAPLRRTFEDLGATYLKFGQLVASSPGVFGDEVANEFRSCLDTGPPVPFPAVRAAVEATIGRPLAQAFRRFEETPVGRASLAVVHRAELADGRPVAVKVLRPGVDAVIATDLHLMRPLFDFLSLRVGVSEAGQLVRLLDGFREQVAEELDLRNEARAMAWYRDLLRDLDLGMIVVPEPYPELSGARVLTMEYLDGVPIDDFAAIAALGLGEAELAEFVRGVMEPLLTRPFGEASLGTLLSAVQGKVGDVAAPTWRARVRRLREQRKLHAGVFAHGAVGSSFDRGTFLLAKQLMYFERYGKLFMADSSLLADREFVAGLLAETLPLAVGRSAS
jgi:ABC1 atypical kinase-like domain